MRFGVLQTLPELLLLLSMKLCHFSREIQRSKCDSEYILFRSVLLIRLDLVSILFLTFIDAVLAAVPIHIFEDYFKSFQFFNVYFIFYCSVLSGSMNFDIHRTISAKRIEI